MDKYLKAALTQTQAEARYQLIAQTKDNITYDLFLKIKKGDEYEGHVTISVELQNVSGNLFLDYAGTNIQEIVINGQKLDTTDNYESLRDRRFLGLPNGNLKTGKNEIRIKFSNLYANDGLGLHTFVDTDGKQYLYSQCEPYSANKIFPCFDQPDLKAVMNLAMAVPNDWVGITNQPATEEAAKRFNVNDFLTAEETSQYKFTAFSSTPRLPTYLYAFVAGPYLEIKSKTIHGSITMSCYCRESLLQYLKDQAEEIFDITRETLKFYESYFDYPYPFAKYDSVFCPEYKFGAMEHPGAVTFNDNLIWREQVTIDENTERADTITHEAAHHWFGDLVTMKWWNDLWLNESFADFISYFCLYKIKNKVTTIKFADPWLSFFTRKGWGYRADQQRSTHPIAGDVANTDQAESIFDGITYSKGAATMKQLMRLIGEENFGKAMGSYFKKFEWSNATLNDFIASLNEYYKPAYQGSPASLEEWKAEWLQKAGLNECTPLFNPDDHSEQAKLTIRQTVALEAHPTLRHHKMQIAFFDKDGKVYDSQDIMLNNTSETVITYNGAKQPQAVFLNYQDESFVKVRLDDHSIEFFREKLTSIPDELTRAMIWRSLFDMVRDGKFSAANFVEIVHGALPNEPSDSCLGNMLIYSNASLILSPSVLNDNVLLPKLFECILKALLATDKANSNKIVLLREYLIKFASFGEQRNVDNVSRLGAWLKGEDNELKGVELDLQNKWSIVSALHGHKKLSDDEKLAYFKRVAAEDSSDRMKINEIFCEAARADGEQRKKLYESYFNTENKLSLKMIKQSMSGYNHSTRTTDSDANAFFDNIVQVFKDRTNEYAQGFYTALFPQKENLEFYIKQVTKLLSEEPENDWLLKSLRDSLDDLERKRRGYICSGPDVMKEFFNVSI